MKKRTAIVVALALSLTVIQTGCNKSSNQSVSKNASETVKKSDSKDEKVVKDVTTLDQVLKDVKAGTTIVLEDGIYKDVKLKIEQSGAKDKPITIKAKNGGKAIFSGDVKIEMLSDYVVLQGIYFKNGARKAEEWKTLGPGFVAMYGDHNRITDCAFNNFDTVDSCWVSTGIRANDNHTAAYNRIDHCSFTDKVSNDQVINLDNNPNRDKSIQGQPMYNRVDHCYFSNPQKTGNAGGGIRVGFFISDTGRCLIDNNLFERQDSEPEIVTSKSRENVYLYNTIKNCQGTLNFRHGSNQVAIGNYFIGDDDRFGYGGMFVWGANHTIANNYFSLSKTLKDRENAAICLNPGKEDSEHSLEYNSLIANNVFAENNGYGIHFNALYERRKDIFKDKTKIPHDNTLINNVFLGNEKTNGYTAFKNDFQNEDRKDVFKSNIIFGASKGYNVKDGFIEQDPNLVKNQEGIYTFKNENPVFNKETFEVKNIEGMENIPGLDFKLDLNKCAHKSIYDKKCITFKEASPTWMKERDSEYYKEGKPTKEIQEYLEKVKNAKKKK